MSRRKRMVKDLIRLSLWEAFASVGLIIAFFLMVRHWKLQVLWFDYLVFFILIFILWQGSFFWSYLARRVKGRVVHNRRYKHLFKGLKRIDRILIGSCFILCFMFDRYIVLNMFILILALFEYFNYFYIRLAYTPGEFIARLSKLRFTRSRLSKEFF